MIAAFDVFLIIISKNYNSDIFQIFLLLYFSWRDLPGVMDLILLSTQPIKTPITADINLDLKKGNIVLYIVLHIVLCVSCILLHTIHIVVYTMQCTATQLHAALCTFFLVD